jgi:pimeloyl-ACP methyl ester carboxylesterase
MNPLKSLPIIAIFVMALVAIPYSYASAQDGIGVLLMHGKGGTAKPRSPIGKLRTTLDDAGFIVVAPDMLWSRSRIWDGGFEDAMAAIDGHVADLKENGATKIVVGGHSLGANAAIAYAARRDGLAGVLAIAPGHIPEVEGFQKRMDFDYKRAREMVERGEGDEVEDFKDFNQGRTSELSAKAKDYLSWYDPEGPAAMPTNLRNLKPNTPLFWIVGEDDFMVKYERSRKYFELAPTHPNNDYNMVEGGHKDTPNIGEGLIRGWLLGL